MEFFVDMILRPMAVVVAVVLSADAFRRWLKDR